MDRQKTEEMLSNIPLFKVSMANDVMEGLGPVLSSGYIGQGPKVEEFESLLKQHFNTDYLLTVNSCTSALQLATHLIKPKEGWGVNDEVIICPLTCFATISSVISTGAKIKWADVDCSTCNIDLLDVERKLTPNTKAVVVVHWAGYPVDLSKLSDMQEKYEKAYGSKLHIIEDCAHCWKSKFENKLIGTSGNFCCFSFQAIKFLTTSDGGLLILPDAETYKRAKLLRWFGLDRDAGASFRCVQNIQESGFKYHCLHRDARVKLPNGKSKRIMNIVKEKCSEEVKTIDENNQVSSRKISGWHKNPLGDRKWYYLYHELSRFKRGGKGSNLIGQKQGVWLTEDHEVLTIHGYVKVSDLKEKDKLLTVNQDFSCKQKSFMIGSLLGDSSIVQSGKGGNCWYSVTHSNKQIEWINLKREIVRNFGTRMCPIEVNINGNTYNTFNLQTRSLPVFTLWRRRFYKDKTKIVPDDLSSDDFTPLSLASWYLDDGVRNGNGLSLCTDNFSLEEVELLSQLLSEKDFKTTIQNHEGNHRIGISSKSGFFEIISPYVPNSMRYKLPESMRKEEYIPDLWDLEDNLESYRLSCSPIVEKGTPKRRPKGCVYCIDVDDTHNFIVGEDIVVHNCNDVAASIGISNLKNANENVCVHKENAEFYYRELASCPKITLLKKEDHFEGSYWIFTMKVQDRDKFIKHMEVHGISVSPVHARCDKHSCVKQFDSFLPNMDLLDKVHISIPCGWWVGDKEREHIVETIKKGW